MFPHCVHFVWKEIKDTGSVKYPVKPFFMYFDISIASHEVLAAQIRIALSEFYNITPVCYKTRGVYLGIKADIYFLYCDEVYSD